MPLFLANFLGCPLSKSGADEKPWSATRRVGETQQADGKRASLGAFSRLLSASAGRFGDVSGWTLTSVQACVKVSGEVPVEKNSLGVTVSYQRIKNGRGEVIIRNLEWREYTVTLCFVFSIMFEE